MKRFITIVVLFLTAAPALYALPARPRQDTLAAQPSKPAVVTRRAAPLRPVAVTGRDDSMLARVTVYWAKGGKGSDRFTRRHQSAIGQRLRTGHCAVDPRKIPYGSSVVLPGGETLAAVDTGTAVKNRKAARKSGRTTNERNALVVDRFFETKGQALAWAAKHPLFMPVRVVRPNYRQAPAPTMVVMKAQRVIVATAPRRGQKVVGSDQLLATNQAAVVSPALARTAIPRR